MECDFDNCQLEEFLDKAVNSTAILISKIRVPTKSYFGKMSINRTFFHHETSSAIRCVSPATLGVKT